MKRVTEGLDIIDARLSERVIDQERFFTLRQPCRPRILIVADGSLNFTPNDQFGLWRFLHGITLAAGVVTKPVITLAHRSSHLNVSSITIENDSYPVQTNFKFSEANPDVTIANYDQIWLFGIEDGNFALDEHETRVIADFMNSGGGMFATGDHAALGRQLSGSLPRIRHMREWSTIPMGTESDVTLAVNRIDTIVNPGANNIYEFEDQSDDIPQRIYPNYKVTESVGGWQATVHPLLMLPGALEIRRWIRPDRNNPNSNTPDPSLGFTRDIDVLPDHAHESVCREVTNPDILKGFYTINGQNFEEFRPAAANPSQKVRPEIVAYAVSGGRSVRFPNGPWKPPVKPQMFGVISAYDGRQAQPYRSTGQRPGRIVCDSTWHHYVNINLDGTGTFRNGLGSWSGGTSGAGTFTPSPALQKIYAFYRNTVSWLQPANRVSCGLWWNLVALRFYPMLIEELLETPRLKSWQDFVGLGQEASNVLTLVAGSQEAQELITGILLSHRPTEALGDSINSNALAQTYVNSTELVHGILGGMLARVTKMLPENDPKALEQLLEAGVASGIKQLMFDTTQLIKLGFEANMDRSERTIKLLREQGSKLKI